MLRTSRSLALAATGACLLALAPLARSVPQPSGAPRSDDVLPPSPAQPPLELTALDATGALHLVYATPDGPLATRWHGGAWSAPERLLAGPARLVSGGLVADGTGALHLVVLALDPTGTLPVELVRDATGWSAPRALTPPLAAPCVHAWRADGAGGTHLLVADGAALLHAHATRTGIATRALGAAPARLEAFAAAPEGTLLALVRARGASGAAELALHRWDPAARDWLTPRPVGHVPRDAAVRCAILPAEGDAHLVLAAPGGAGAPALLHVHRSASGAWAPFELVRGGGEGEGSDGDAPAATAEPPAVGETEVGIVLVDLANPQSTALFVLPQVADLAAELQRAAVQPETTVATDLRAVAVAELGEAAVGPLEEDPVIEYVWVYDPDTDVWNFVCVRRATFTAHLASGLDLGVKIELHTRLG